MDYCYFIGFLQGWFCNDPVNRIQDYVLGNSLTLLGVNLVFDQQIYQTLCDSYFTELILDSIGKVSGNKSDTVFSYFTAF